MQLIIAENIGFCFGVERAIDIARKQCEKHGRIYTYGELIHNSDVIAGLREEGIEPVDNLSEIPKGSTVIIRSHGVGPQEIAECAERGLNAIDATCPFVEKIHKYVDDMSREGRKIIINGGEMGEKTRKLYDTLTGIQYGKLADNHGWSIVL